MSTTNNIVEVLVPAWACGGCIDEYTYFGTDENDNAFKLKIDVSQLRKQVEFVREHMLKEDIVDVRSVHISASALLSVQSLATEPDESPRLEGYDKFIVFDSDVYWSDYFKSTSEILEVNLADLGIHI